jgi:cobalt/nickel transport protein
VTKKVVTKKVVAKKVVTKKVITKKMVWFLTGGLLVALVLAGVVSSFASSSPDGLDAAALQGCTVDNQGAITGGECMAQQAQGHQMADSPLANYGFRGIDNRLLSTGLSGVAGVLLTFGIGAGIFWAVKRRAPARTSAREGQGGD